ncbi:MAG: hypothetical protein Q7R67_00800 [bacterium]|nr:hypothetical protein [bacterium]
MHSWEEAALRYEKAKGSGWKKEYGRKKVITHPQHLDIRAFVESEEGQAAQKLLKAKAGMIVLVDAPRRERHNGSDPLAMAIGFDGEGLCEFTQICGFTPHFGAPKPSVQRLTLEEALRKIQGFKKGASSEVHMPSIYMALDYIANQAP